MAAPAVVGHDAPVSIQRWLPSTLLWVGVGAVVASIPIMYRADTAAKELPWIAGTAVFVTCAAIVLRRRKHERIAQWFAITAGLVGIIQMLDGLLLRVANAADAQALAWIILSYYTAMVLAGIALAHLLGLFPDDVIERTYERRIVRALWALLAVPAAAFVSTPTLTLPSYHQLAPIENPYQLSSLAFAADAAATGLLVMQAVFIVGAILLVPRYLRAGTTRRRQIRWLLVPALFAAVVAAADFIAWQMYPQGAPTLAAEIVLSTMWIVVISSLPAAIAIALLRPDLLDVDRVIRRSLVYGALWAGIATVYVAAALALGIAAGQRFPLVLAIALTVIATMIFQPARRRLERAADRWVFGSRADPSQVIAQLGATLETTVELESLLPRMADALQEGLGLTWARVRLDTDLASGRNGVAPVLTVPIQLHGEQLGVVECGPKRSGQITDDDEMIVATLARQAALAVRNVRLTSELNASRGRLVKAQDAERRRLERDLHDGVQQSLVALLGHVARARQHVADEPQAATAIDELQAGLTATLAELRELARGFHPSVHTDRGLLEAVEALAARSALQVVVHADEGLRGMRIAQEAEGAAYFTVAEALSNAGKHAPDSHVDVELTLRHGLLEVAVVDDGPGFDQEQASGSGLANLAERVAALSGSLEVDSAVGAGTRLTARLKAGDG